MAIAKNPKRTKTPTAETFIAAAGREESEADKKKPVLLRFSPQMWQRVDLAAKRLGISRSAFVYSSTAEKLERMEG